MMLKVHKYQRKNYHPNTKQSYGFSLVELLVVVAILAILAAIAIPLFLNQRSKASQGAVQSDARNLSTNLTNLFANLPRSADPNVGLNGGTAPNTTLSGSGTIEVGGETLNITLSPDVTITKTGNVAPALGAGLKITHAGVENWACVISLPPSVGYAQAFTFQPACGTVVSEAGNLFKYNEGVLSSGLLLYRVTADYGPEGPLSGVTLTSTSTGAGWAYTSSTVPVSAGQVYTFNVEAVNVSRDWSIKVQWRVNGSNFGGLVSSGTVSGGSSGVVSLEATAPEGVNGMLVNIYSGGGEVGDVSSFKNFGAWAGSGGVWSAPGSVVVQP